MKIKRKSEKTLVTVDDLDRFYIDRRVEFVRKAASKMNRNGIWHRSMTQHLTAEDVVSSVYLSLREKAMKTGGYKLKSLENYFYICLINRIKDINKKANMEHRKVFEPGGVTDEYEPITLEEEVEHELADDSDGV